VPTIVGPGQTVELTNPNGNTYYQHQGASTTAQYYVNPLGVGLSEACNWGSASATPNWGNWAPVVSQQGSL
jgi:hypothetical protein